MPFANKRNLAVSAVIAAFLIISCGGTKAPLVKKERINPSLFRSVAAELEKARSEGVHELSPSFFESAKRMYLEALEEDKRGNSSAAGRKLAACSNLLSQARENAEAAKKTMAFLIDAREDAIAANAPKHVPKLCKEAAELFQRAMRELEDGDKGDAMEDAREAEKKYRKAELIAIKKGVLGEVRKAVAAARKKRAYKQAPKTFKKAVRLLAKAEQILNTNRYSKAKAGKLAEAAAYEARHAMFLSAWIKEMDKRDVSTEQLILKGEDALHNIGKELGVRRDFLKGYDGYSKEASEAASRIVRDRKELSTQLASARKRIKVLENKVAELERKTGKLTLLQQQIRERKKIDRTIAAIRKMFSRSEGKVLLDGKDLVLRLYGLSFPPGKADVQPECYPLLVKVQRVVRLFPDKMIVIEGHTDSLGSPQFNDRLSQKRAAAVEAYLIANAAVTPERVTSIGYGSRHPVAPNTTAKGRRMNRRIDVVIKDALY